MRRISYFHLPLITAVITLLLSYSLDAREPDGGKLRGPRLDKTAVVDLETVDGNRIFDYINNRGAWCTHNNPIGFGMQWPGQSGHSVDFASGIWVAGLVNDKIHTAAAEYTYEYQPGNIRPDGTPEDPNDPRHQILKITKADLLDEGFSNPDYGAWINDLYQLGAPIKRDANGQPILSPSGKRIPDMIGDQMLWMVYNDANPGNHTLFGTAPIGLEVQNTVWVFNRPDAFGDMMFMKFLLVNKGENTLKDAFIGLWFDIDLGDSNDDLVFCDSTLSLGAFWNDGDGAPPPPGTTIRFVTTKPNSVNDVFTFSTQDYQALATQTDAVAAAQLVNIFPNPYFGQNPAEIDPVNRFVTITHLPGSNVTIRVFTLAGDIIKTIDDGVRQQQGTLGTQIAYWDLRNDQDVPVASGMYLIHVDMKELGQKVLKAAIFMPEERLDKF
ncbi:MAG: hypothetical protein ACE5HO_06285 [bacterium]